MFYAQTPDDSICAAVTAKWREIGSYRKLAAALNLPAKDAALLNKIARGEPVSDATARRIGRALGILPQPRRLIRRCMTPEQAAAWDRLTPAERNEKLGI